MVSPTSVVAAESEVVSCEMGGGLALLDLRSSTYYSINTVGAVVWELLQAPKPVTAVCEGVVARFNVDPERCQADVLALVERLQSAGLVTVTDGAPA